MGRVETSLRNLEIAMGRPDHWRPVNWKAVCVDWVDRKAVCAHWVDWKTGNVSGRKPVSVDWVEWVDWKPIYPEIGLNGLGRLGDLGIKCGGN